MDANRRSFLGRLAGVMLAAFGGSAFGGWLLNKIKEPSYTAMARKSPSAYYVSGPLRPPGAVREGLFEKLCIECFLCAEVCPPKAIRFMTSGGGLKGNTPYIFPRERACILCMKCTLVCPTQALKPLQEDDIYDGKKKVDMGTAEIDKRMCVTHLKIGKCESCYTICPLKERAITQEALLKPKVLEEGCVGCGLCEEICPVKSKAIRVRPPGHEREERDILLGGVTYY